MEGGEGGEGGRGGEKEIEREGRRVYTEGEGETKGGREGGEEGDVNM